MTVQIQTTKEVPIYYYKGYLSKFVNGRWEDTREFLFKSTLKDPFLTREAIVKGVSIKMADTDCLYWEELDLQKYFDSLAEV